MKKETLQQIPHKYYEQLYTNKLKNLEEMDKFLKTCNLPGLNHEAREKLNGLILSKEIESIIKYLPKSCKTRWLHQPSSAAAKSLQLCPTLYDPIDGSPPSSAVPGILQARILEWVAISFSSA